MWWRPLSWAFRARNNSFLWVYMSHHPSNESREIRNAKVLWGLRNQLIYLKVWCGERRETLSLCYTLAPIFGEKAATGSHEGVDTKSFHLHFDYTTPHSLLCFTCFAWHNNVVSCYPHLNSNTLTCTLHTAMLQNYT